MGLRIRGKRSAAALAAALALAWGCGGGSENCAVTDTCPNQRPSATIGAPANGASVVEGTAVVFQGSATDPEDGTLTGASLTWTSSLDAQIGTGLTFARSDLSLGTHTIRLIARDSRGAADTASIALTMVANQPPVASITAPPDGGSASQGASVPFSGSADDPEDGALTGGSLVWASSLDGQIGTGTSFSRDDLSVGDHTITLEATDGGGKSGTASLTFTIIQGLSVAIDQPTPGPNGEPAGFATGASVTFQGTATDTEDGPLTGGSLVWTSNVDGQVIGTGESFARNDLPDGMHTITLTATDSDANTATATVLVNITPPSDPAGFDILLRLSEGVTLTAGQQTALENARARWEAILPAELANISFSMGSEFQCGGATVPAFDETVDDLIVYIEFEDIDGPGGVLGSAGPCLVRDFAPQGSLQPGDLPFLGGMRFDTADLQALEAAGRLEAVILHEMGHVLGFGSLWGAFGQLQNPSLGTACGSQPDTHFDGAQAVAAMLALEAASMTTYTGGARVPVENDVCTFVAGSLDSHWRESVFTNELMTPAIGAGLSPLSTLTIESMEDLGYSVEPGQADPYSPAFTLTAEGDAAGIVLRGDVADGPIWAVTPRGDVRRIR